MVTDTPIHTDGSGRWWISSPAGRETAVGQAFDENRGYLVTLKFTDSRNWNSLSVDAARTAVRTVREQLDRNADARAVADAIERWAESCERLNEGWRSMGRPSGGFDTQVHGHA